MSKLNHMTDDEFDEYDRDAHINVDLSVALAIACMSGSLGLALGFVVARMI